MGEGHFPRHCPERCPREGRPDVGWGRQDRGVPPGQTSRNGEGAGGKCGKGGGSDTMTPQWVKGKLRCGWSALQGGSVLGVANGFRIAWESCLERLISRNFGSLIPVFRVPPHEAPGRLARPPPSPYHCRGPALCSVTPPHLPSFRAHSRLRCILAGIGRSNRPPCAFRQRALHLLTRQMAQAGQADPQIPVPPANSARPLWC